jgi:hypothetical protein
MPIGPFSKYLSKFTSDHTYQSVTVEAETADHRQISLTGMTWDLLNKGHSAAMGGGHSNNPFDLDEPDRSYLLRKKKQLRMILKRISHREMDFIFLQEVDIFTKSNPRKINEEHLAAEFFQAVKKLNWEFIYSHKAEDNIVHPLVTFYNAQELEFVTKRGLFAGHNGVNCALETEFLHIETGCKIYLVNMYLDPNLDQSKEIEKYQLDQVLQGKFTIIGGNTNAAEDVSYYGLIGDENMATSIASATDVFPRRNVGFMAGPASKDTYVVIKEWLGTFFKLRSKNMLSKILDKRRGLQEEESVFMAVKVKPNVKHLSHNLHKSYLGVPWARKLRVEKNTDQE